MQQKISINEIFPNPETQNEWVELKIDEETNQNSSLVNYTLFDSYHQICKFNNEQFTNQLLVVEVSGLNNDQDSVVLKDDIGNILDSFSYTQTQKGLSWSKDDNGNFIISEPSRNQINPSKTPTPTNIETSPSIEPTQISPSPSTSISSSSSPSLSPTKSVAAKSTANAKKEDIKQTISISSNYHSYDLNKIKLTSEQKIFKERLTRLVFLGKDEEQARVLNAIIGSSLIILSALFLIYVKVKNRHN